MNAHIMIPIGHNIKVCGMMYRVHNLTLKIICILNKFYQYSTQLDGSTLEVVNIPNQMTAIRIQSKNTLPWKRKT